MITNDFYRMKQKIVPFGVPIPLSRQSSVSEKREPDHKKQKDRTTDIEPQMTQINKKPLTRYFSCAHLLCAKLEN